MSSAPRLALRACRTTGITSGLRSPTPWRVSPTIIDGRLYTSEGRGGNGMAAYDLSDPARPRSAGHFATPNAHAVKVTRLLNGQLLVAGDRFYVLDPPRAVE